MRKSLSPTSDLVLQTSSMHGVDGLPLEVEDVGEQSTSNVGQKGGTRRRLQQAPSRPL